MRDNIDTTLKDCFSVRTQPPPEVKAALREKLLVAELKRENKWTWAIVLYSFLFSATSIFAVWILTGNKIIVSVSIIFSFTSAVSAVIVTIACKAEQNKKRRAYQCC